MPLQITANTRPTANLRIAANQRARLSSVLSIDWDNITGGPVLDQVPDHYVAVGAGSGDLAGIAPGSIGRMLVSNGASADPSFVLPPWFDASLYASLQAACDAAEAAGGGAVFVPASVGLGSGAKGLDLDGITVPIWIFGPNGGVNGGAGQQVMLTYTGTGSMISAIGAFGLEISHLYMSPSGAGAKIINAKDSFALSVHDCMLAPSVSSASNLGIDLDTAQIPVIRRNGIGMNGGTGVRGVVTSFSVKAIIAENTFFSSCNVAIEAPGQDWHVLDNVAQDPTTNFIKKGPPGTCDVLVIEGNDIDDGTGAKTWITSNAGVLISKGNRYTNSGTCISQDNSTGAVISIGDRLQASVVGIAIGTGNYLTVEAPDQGHLPTTLYSGTPANTNVVKTIGGAVDITGTASFGLSGSYAGTQKFWNTTSGANSVTVIPPAGAIGLVTETWPSTTGTLLNTTNNIVVTQKVFDNTNAYTIKDTLLTLQDNSDATKQAVFELSGITTGNTRTYTLPDASGTLLYSGGPGAFTSITYSTTLTGTSTNASALAVGRQGATNPVLQVDASTASVATGLKIKGAAAAGGLALSVITSGTNENLTLDAAGSGTITLGGTSTGGITLTRATTMSAALTYGGVTLSNSVSGTGSMALTAGTTFTGTTTVNALSASSVSASSSIALTNNQNATTKVSVNNSDGGASADAFFEGSNGTNVIRFGMRGTAETAYGALTSGRAFIYGAVDFVTMSDGGNLIFAAGGNTESGRIDTSGNLSWANSILSSHATKGIGYKTGAGGTVTQITSRTTGVTLNTACGAITLFAAAPAVGTWVSFTVTNSAVVATDVPHVAVKSGTNTYIAHVTAVGAGSFQISFTSIVGTASDSPVINFDLCKAVTS